VRRRHLVRVVAMRYAVATVLVVLALVLAAGANSAATDFNVDGAQISTVEGIRFQGIVATFTDPLTGQNTYKATLDWGDGTTDGGTVTYSGEKKSNHLVYNVTGSHTWAKAGTYTVTVKVEGPGGQGTSKPTATVTAAPISVTVAFPPVVEGGTVNVAIATRTSQNPGATASSLNATISWGDGATSGGVIAQTSATTFSVSGTHTFVEEGQVTVTVTASSAGGSTTTMSQLITIGDAPLTAGAPTTLHGVEG